ncbi:tetratricopeptide repeat protein [Sphingobium abikonense]|uniref:tetratricopeptide repeat protein n=1 Tax=Sphingobium abikonense TaxID=86193 RepID=UPI0035188A6C
MRLRLLLPIFVAISGPAFAQGGHAVTGITGINFNAGYDFGTLSSSSPAYSGDGAFSGPPDRKPVGALQHARELVAQGKYDEADPILNRLMGRTPSKDVRFLRGVTKLGLGDADAARRYFVRSVHRGFHYHPGSLSGLALAEIRLGNVDAANDILARLRKQQAACDNRCERAPALDAAITVVEKNLT